MVTVYRNVGGSNSGGGSGDGRCCNWFKEQRLNSAVRVSVLMAAAVYE